MMIVSFELVVLFSYFWQVHLLSGLSGNLIHVISLLENIDNIQKYSWGSCILDSCIEAYASSLRCTRDRRTPWAASYLTWSCIPIVPQIASPLNIDPHAPLGARWCYEIVEYQHPEQVMR